MRLKVTSDGTKAAMIDEDTGYRFPIRSLAYSIELNSGGLLTVEIQVDRLDSFRFEVAGEAKEAKPIEYAILPEDRRETR